jgi:hypothetical protein
MRCSVIAVCIHNLGSQLADHQRGRFTGFEETFNLTVGSRYPILGMAIFETTLCLLVVDDWGGPLFAPAGLFDCEDQPLPAEWRFSLLEAIAYSGRDLWTRCIAVWGYPELVTDPTHMEALANRGERALQIFRMAVQALGRQQQGPARE